MSPLQRDLLAGATAGLLAGLVVGLATWAQGMLASSVAGVALQVLVAALLGAAFGALVRYQPGAYAFSLSIGIVYGLLWWILGPLTLLPLLLGPGPTWSLAEASATFPSLIGYLLYGGLTGLGFTTLATLLLHLRPVSEPAAPVQAPTRRVLILGGGYFWRFLREIPVQTAAPES